MKITGLILALVGFLGGALCVTQLVLPIGPARDVPAVQGSPDTRIDLMVPLTISAIAFVVGLAMIAFGGRGYSISNNPRVRN
jgi:hypothetical protein